MVALKNPKNIDTGWGDLDMFQHLSTPGQFTLATDMAWNGGGYSKEHAMCDAPKMVLSTMDTLLAEHRWGKDMARQMNYDAYPCDTEYVVNTMHVRETTYQNRRNYGHYNTVKHTYA